jgi:hypothetical protein
LTRFAPDYITGYRVFGLAAIRSEPEFPFLAVRQNSLYRQPDSGSGFIELPAAALYQDFPARYDGCGRLGFHVHAITE